MNSTSPTLFGRFRSSLRARVALGVAFPVLLAMSTLSITHYWRERQQIEEQIQLNALQVGDVALAGLRNSMLRNEPSTMAEIITDIGRMENIQRVQLIDQTYRVTLDTSGGAQGQVRQADDPGCSACHDQPGNSRPRTTILSFVEDTLRISTPIENTAECVTCHPGGDRHLGVLLIDVSLTDARAHVTNDLQIDLAISGGFTLMVTAGVYLLMHLLVVRRVERFRQPLKAFANGDLTARLPSPRDPGDELDILTSAFNHMATELEQQIEEREQRHQLRQRAIIEERERIAREMHDGIAQLMGYVNTKAAAVRLLLMNGRLDEAQSQLNQLSEAAEVSFIELRASILGLRISDHEGHGFVATLQEFITKFSQMTGIQVDVSLPPQGVERFLPYESELHLLRIAQEALSNVHKHSSTKHAWVDLKRDDHLLELTIGDHGTGFNPEHPKDDHRPHFGLSTMRERAEAIGASFLVDAVPGRGTRITILLPLEAN